METSTVIVTHIDEYNVSSPLFVIYLMVMNAAERLAGVAVTSSGYLLRPFLLMVRVARSILLFATSPLRYVVAIWPELRIALAMFTAIACFAGVLGVTVGLAGRFLLNK